MQRLVLGLLGAALFTLSAAPAAAQNASVYVIHGIRGGDLGLAPALPVDVSVDGQCTLRGFTFGTVTGPISLPAATYQVAISLAAPAGAAGCTGPQVIAAPVPVSAGETATIIAHLTAGGAPTASKFVNDVTSTGPGRARIQAHHTAAAPAVDVVVGRDLDDPTAPTVIVPDFVNGSRAVAPVQPGEWQAALRLAGTSTTALGPVTLRLRPFTGYYVYAVGSASVPDSLTFIVQTIGNLR